jgi:hypothetical protein
MSNIIVTEPMDWNRENSRIQLVCHYINGTLIIIVYTYRHKGKNQTTSYLQLNLSTLNSA